MQLLRLLRRFAAELAIVYAEKVSGDTTFRGAWYVTQLAASCAARSFPWATLRSASDL